MGVEEIQVEPLDDVPGQGDGFFALLGRMSNRFDLDEGDAERIAVEEQHAWRRERREQREQDSRDRAGR